MNAGTLDDRKPESGFTMVEVMIAILLTAIAVIGIMALFMTEMKASSYSRHATEATVLAADKLEKLRTMTSPATGTDPLNPIDPNGATGGIYDRSWEVTSVGSPATYVDVAVTISWDENGATKSVTLHGRRQP
jgi:prepilin-type N-terminal cleavage/methylation domain-containing protein